MENKKRKAKYYYRANKEKLKNRSREYYRILSEKKKNANARYKNMSDAERERKTEHMKNYYYKRKKLLNHVTDRVEELEKVNLNK